ncbi:MAG: prepilin-type N-terminal cleavage/methylation domain-containing protein [Bacteriovoracaceae bacterium]|jgi:prepilin-type N-terminal cleavage/methylation domain-containing protein|nr:prepilin-type N-terminal cleavage/methylation domain-containing protein [Bacteriovoracaceae bacterium]
MKNLLRTLHNDQKGQSGFSLVEVMIAAGMLGVVSLAVMQMTTNMHKSTKSIEQQSSSMDLLTLTQGILSDEVSCANTLTGITLSAVGGDVAEIQDKLGNAIISNGTVFAAGTPGALSVTGIKIRGFSTAPQNPRVYDTNSPRRQDYNDAVGVPHHMGPADIEITLRKSSDVTDTDQEIQRRTLGQATKIIRVGINVVTSTGFVIESCFGDQDRYILASCNSLNGKIDGTGKCVETHVGTGAGGEALGQSGMRIGNALSQDVSQANRNSVPLKILRNDDPTDPATGVRTVLLIDEDEIQTVRNNVAVGSVLKLNEEGGTVQVGSGTLGDLLVPGTLSVTGEGTGATDVSLGNDNTDRIVITGTTRITGPGVTIGDNSTQVRISGSGIDLLGPGLIRIGNDNADTVTIQGNPTTLLGPSIRVGDNNLDVVTIQGSTNLLGNNINIGDSQSDTINLTGTTDINGTTLLRGTNITIGDGNLDQITLQGQATLTPSPPLTAADSAIPTMGTVRVLLATVLAPELGSFMGVLADIMAANLTNDYAIQTQRNYTCNSIRIANKSGVYTTKSGTCDFNTPDTRCDASNVCSQVCIGNICKTSWPGTGSGSCSYKHYVYRGEDINPSNSNQGSYDVSYDCPAGFVVTGHRINYIRVACGNHQWRSYLKCCN